MSRELERVSSWKLVGCGELPFSSFYSSRYVDGLDRQALSQLNSQRLEVGYQQLSLVRKNAGPSFYRFTLCKLLTAAIVSPVPKYYSYEINQAFWETKPRGDTIERGFNSHSE